MVSKDIRSLTGNGFQNRWNKHTDKGSPVVVTYSFGNSKAAYETSGFKGYESWSPAHKAEIRKALKKWEEASGITFVEVPDSQIGDIRFAMVDLTGRKNATGDQVSGFGYFPGWGVEQANDKFVSVNSHANIGGDIFLHSQYYAANAGELAPGSRGFSIVLHEIGHAIGFKHPFEGTPKITPSHDNGAYTVMSYDRPRSTTELGTVDKAASKLIYGPAKASIDAKFVQSTNTLVQKTGRKDDDIAGSHLKDKIVLRKGDDRSFGLDRNDKLLGGDGDDKLFGGNDNDTLKGGGGSDRLFGGGKNDSLDGGRGPDLLKGEDGKDMLDGGSKSDTLAGGAGNDLLLGGSSKDTIEGGSGKDRIDGGKGDDKLTGGPFDFERDVFVFRKGDGKDTIEDFEPGIDRIEFVSGAKSEDDLSIRQNSAGNVVISYDGGKIILDGVSLEDIEGQNVFVF